MVYLKAEIAMAFEFDENKSNINKQKHKICFIEAQNLWHDENAIELIAQTHTEVRYYFIAQYKDKFWTAIFAKRNENVRLISVRRSRKNEEKLYDREKDNS